VSKPLKPKDTAMTPLQIQGSVNRLTEWADAFDTEAKYGDPGSIEVYDVMLDDLRVVLEAVAAPPAMVLG
jgi:hypothetical protein